ncbi:MAG: putative periplasmic ligand-binding sensor domain protein, partial [Bacteroidetes bacterium]|nr:putative periplasmic ligand-binding sensor domain protein [Bacteroidota bacterium]
GGGRRRGDPGGDLLRQSRRRGQHGRLSRGIALVLDPGNPERSGGIASYTPLSGQTVNSIAVDALNQKWVGTNEGAVLLSSDGTQVLASYTTENTSGRLMDNRVLSVAVDQRTGTVYFGTPVGLASLSTSAAAPAGSFDELQVYPNPFIVPSTQPVTVDGLVEGSRIRILSVDGRVIADLPTPGGRIGFWDGKNTDGEDVASGVYLVVGYSEDGQQVGTGKVAVVRR